MQSIRNAEEILKDDEFVGAGREWMAWTHGHDSTQIEAEEHQEYYSECNVSVCTQCQRNK